MPGNPGRVWTLLWALAVVAGVRAQCGQKGCLSCDATNACVLCDGFAGYTLAAGNCTLAPIANCDFVKAANTCASCRPGYFLGKDGACHSQPQVKIQNCLQYSSYFSCEICQTGFYPDTSGLCQALATQIANCLYYSSASVCRACVAGYLLNPLLNLCIKYANATNCGLYVSPFPCLTCDSDYVLNPKWPIQNIKSVFPAAVASLLAATAAGLNPILNYPSCSRKTQNDYCVAYSSPSLCSQCMPGYFLTTGYTCAQNPTNFQTNLDLITPNCAAVDVNNVCKFCTDGYFYQASNTSCVAHSPYVTNCFLMSQAVPNSCLVCLSGFYLDRTGSGAAVGTQCTSRTNKPPFCDQFTVNQDTCSRCQLGFVLANSGKDCKRPLPNCATHDATSATLACVTCALGYTVVQGLCQLIDANCVQYSGSTCVQCLEGFLLSTASLCVASTEAAMGRKCATYGGLGAGLNQLCSTCPVNHINSIWGNICRPELSASNCMSYALDGTCAGCNEGYYSIQGVCSPISNSNCVIFQGLSTSLCRQCRQGYFLNSQGTCQPMYTSLTPLDSNCLQMADASTCAVCLPGFFRTARMTFTVALDCSTPAATQNCAVFSSDYSVCVACLPGFFLQSSSQNAACVATCGAGKVTNLATQTCEDNTNVVAVSSSFSDCSFSVGSRCLGCATTTPQYDFSSINWWHSRLRVYSIQSSSAAALKTWVAVSACAPSNQLGEIAQFVDQFGLTQSVVPGYTTFYQDSQSVLTAVNSLPIKNCQTASPVSWNFPNEILHYKTFLACAQCVAGKTPTLTNNELATTVTQITSADYNDLGSITGQARLPSLVCATYLVFANCALQEWDPNLQAIVCVACSPKFSATFTNGQISACTAIANCATSTLLNGCESCNSGFYLSVVQWSQEVDYTTCVVSTPDPNCIVYLPSLTQCKICAANFFPNAGGVCAPVTLPTGCSSTFGSSSCGVCTAATQYVRLRFSSYLNTQCIPTAYLNTTDANRRCGLHSYNAPSLAWTCQECSTESTLCNGQCVSKTTIPNCAVFACTNNALACQSCGPGFTLNSNACLAKWVPAVNLTNCKVQESFNSCAVCNTGFFLVVENDVSFGGTVGYCVEQAIPPGALKVNPAQFAGYKNLFSSFCLPGYAPSTQITSSTCVRVQTIANCANQVAATCLACSSGYYLSNNACVARTVTTVGCVQYFATGDFCQTTIGTVTTTPVTFWFYTAPNLQYFSSSDLATLALMPIKKSTSTYGIFKCTQYASSSICSQCAGGYYVSANACLTVNKIVSNCATYLTNGICQICQTGYLLVSGVCNQITASNCLTYKDAATCATCPPAYALLNEIGSCVQPFSEPRCLSFGQDSLGNWSCKTCLSTFYPNAQVCSPVQSFIAHCRYYDSANTCSQCHTGYFLSQSKIACSAISGFEPNCHTFAAAASCSLCSWGFYLSQGSCVACTTDKSCLVCDPDIPSVCVVCASGYYMTTSKTCVANPA